ncbi:MAG: TonB-dependent receptor plug domain-containing protein, partial [Bacteroidota bacterium]
KLEETPLSIQRLSREEIATYPGGNNDIARVVQSLPGVSGSVGGFRNDVIIRGGAPSENVYYLDGIEIPNINHFATQGSAGGPVGLLNVSFFEGVTLTTSAFGAQYDNALSGVLQFDQREGNAKGYNTNLRVSSSETALTVEGPMFKKKENERGKTTFIGSVRRSYLQLLFQAIGLPFLPDYWDYQYKVNHKMDNRNEFNFIGLGSIDNFSINADDDLDAEQQATLEQVPVIQQQTTTHGVSWLHRLKDGKGFMRTALSTNYFENNFERYEDNENKEGLFFRNQSVEWETKLRYELTRFAGEWTLGAGATLQNAYYESKTFDGNNNVDFDVDNNFIRYGGYFQASRGFADNRIRPSFGIRFDGNTFTNTGNEFWRTFSPRFALAVQLDESARWTFNASAGRYFKIPPYTILGFQNSAGQFANQDAEYIRSDHLVAGFEFLPTPSTRLTVEGFLKLYNDYPVSTRDSVSLANLGAGFEVFGNEEIRSVGKGRSYGVEFLYQQKLAKNFYGILAYTLYWSEYTGFDEDEYLPSVWDNRHLLTFTGGYKLPRNWELGLRARILGSTPFAPVDTEATNAVYPQFVFAYDQLGQERLETFSQVDIRIDKKWNFKKWTFNLFLEVENALGSQIPNPPTYGLARNDQGEIETPQRVIEIMGVDNSAVLPSLGIVVDF